MQVRCTDPRLIIVSEDVDGEWGAYWGEVVNTYKTMRGALRRVHEIERMTRRHAAVARLDVSLLPIVGDEGVSPRDVHHIDERAFVERQALYWAKRLEELGGG